MNEEWRKVPIKRFSFYEVSDKGNVRNGTRILKQGCTRGYFSVTLCDKGYRKTIHVHKLVAMAFLNRKYNQKWINHKDGNKENNNVDNLEWCTPSENQKHSWRNGMTVFTEKMRQVAIVKILREVEKQKRKVLCFSNGVLVDTYESASEAARQIKGSQPHISDCCNGKRQHHKGYMWKWA
jgi:hypothetical protein